jgi:hypothetical protein
LQNVVPKVTDREAEAGQSIVISPHAELADMLTYNRLQLLADLRNRGMHASPQLDLYFLQLGLHVLANRLPKHQKPSILCLPVDMREAEEVEGLWLT